MRQALRVRDFRLLWAGGLVSSFGSWLLVIAIPAHVFLVTRSLRATGLTLAAEYLPALVLGPFAGVFTDRWDRRRLMVTTSLFRAAAVAAMLLGTSPGWYWVLYAALAAENGGGALYTPAARARLPAIVGTGTLLTGANSLNALTGGIMGLIGGPLGGILLGVAGIQWLIWADALSYVVCAAASALTSRTDSASKGSAGKDSAGEDSTGTFGDLGRDLAEGMRVLRNQPAARALFPVTVIFLAANASLTAVLIPFGVTRLGGGEHMGFLLSFLSAGVLLSAPLLRTLPDRVRTRNLLTASLTCTAAAYFALFTSSRLATALPAAAAVGLSGTMSVVVPQTTLQRVIPNAALGRVSAAFLTGEAAATLIGAVAGPLLTQTVHLTGIASVASVATLVAAGLTFLTVGPVPTTGGGGGPG